MKKVKYYVTATDSFLSGWGMAKDKINKIVLECDSMSQAQTVLKNLKKRNEMKYVNICKNKPNYNRSRYLESYKTIDDSPAFYKE